MALEGFKLRSLVSSRFESGEADSIEAIRSNEAGELLDILVDQCFGKNICFSSLAMYRNVPLPKPYSHA